MKKHLFGFAIFSLVVSTAIIVSAIFSSSHEVFMLVVETTYGTRVTTSCWKMKGEYSQTESVTAKQAILDLKAKEISFHLDIPNLDFPLESRIALHFFVKDIEGSYYLATEFPAPMIQNASGQRGIIKSNYWLNNLSSYQNLYVIPELISNRDFERGIFNPKFDESKATAVTINSGKSFYKTSRK
jgi:hypothetical protein